MIRLDTPSLIMIKEKSLSRLLFSNLNLKLLRTVLDALSSKIIVQLFNKDAWNPLRRGEGSGRDAAASQEAGAQGRRGIEEGEGERAKSAVGRQAAVRTAPAGGFRRDRGGDQEAQMPHRPPHPQRHQELLREDRRRGDRPDSRGDDQQRPHPDR